MVLRGDKSDPWDDASFPVKILILGFNILLILGLILILPVAYLGVGLQKLVFK